jgi:hypothetical protein
VEKKRVRDLGQAVFVFASEMEHPLEQARSLAVAMRLLGRGMIADYNPECGEPVFAIADAINDRLEEVLNLWEKLFEAAGTLAPAGPDGP